MNWPPWNMHIRIAHLSVNIYNISFLTTVNKENPVK